MRVHELARALELPSRQVIALLRADGEWVGSHLSLVPKPVADSYLVGLASRSKAVVSDRSSVGRQPVQTSRKVALNAVLPPLPRRRRRPGPRPFRLNSPEDDEWSQRRYCEPEITTRDIADLLGVTPAAVRRWVARGYISPSGKFGPSNVFRSADVFAAHEQIIARQRATGRPRRARGRWFVEQRQIDRIPAKYWDSVLSVDDAAKLVEVSPATIRSWIHRGHLTPLASSTRRVVRLRGVDVIRAAHSRRLPNLGTLRRRRSAG